MSVLILPSKRLCGGKTRLLRFISTVSRSSGIWGKCNRDFKYSSDEIQLYRIIRAFYFPFINQINAHFRNKSPLRCAQNKRTTNLYFTSVIRVDKRTMLIKDFLQITIVKKKKRSADFIFTALDQQERANLVRFVLNLLTFLNERFYPELHEQMAIKTGEIRNRNAELELWWERVIGIRNGRTWGTRRLHLRATRQYWREPTGNARLRAFLFITITC